VQSPQNGVETEAAQMEQEDEREQMKDATGLAVVHPSSFFMRRGIDSMRTTVESNLVHTVVSEPCVQVDQRVPCKTARFGALCRAPQVLFRLFGIVRWRKGLLSSLYCKLLTVVPACLGAFSLYVALLRGLSGIEAVSHGAHAFGCFMAMVGLQLHSAHMLNGSDSGLLDSYAIRYQFTLEWHWVSFGRFIAILLGGILTLMARLWLILEPACYGSAADEIGGILLFTDLACSTLTTGFMVTLMYWQVHVSGGLFVGVDMCSMQLVKEKDLGSAMLQWNLLQAVLRQAANAIDSAFCGFGLALVTLLIYACLKLMQEAQQSPADFSCTAMWYGWMAPPWCIMLYVFFRAADVTQLCIRVPSIINGMSFGANKVLYDTQDAARYIIQSEAGFYIEGVRITSSLAVKITYLLCIVVWAVLSQSFLRK